MNLFCHSCFPSIQPVEVVVCVLCGVPGPKKQNSLKHTQNWSKRWGVAVLRPTANSEVGSPSCVHITHGNGRQKQKKLRKHRVKSVATPETLTEKLAVHGKTRKPCNKHRQTRAKSLYPTCAMNFIVCSPAHHHNTDTKENMEKHRGCHRFCRYKSDFGTQNYTSGVSQEKKPYKRMSKLEKMFLQKFEGFTA